MKPSTLAVIVVSILVLIGGVFYILSSDSSDQSPVTSQDGTFETQPSLRDNDDPGTTEEALEQFTLEQVAVHNQADDCWTVINGSVYDITSYVPRHPGGDEILLACGTDGTSLFTQRTAEDGDTIGSGTPHTPNAARQLEALKIGVLAQ